MTAIPPIAVSPATLQTLAGQNTPAQASAVSAPQAIAAVQAALSEQKAMLFAVLQQALGDAAPRQNGLAPLMADAEAMLARSDPPLPQNVREALKTLLATRLSGPGGVDAAKLQTAVKQSGVFLESGLANGQSVTGDLKAALLGLRQTLQSWLGPQTGNEAIKTALMPGNTVTASPQTPAAPQATPHSLPSTPQTNTLGATSAPYSALPPLALPLRDAALRLLAETDAVLERPIAQPVAGTSTPLKANLEAMLARTDAPLPQAVRDAIQIVLGQKPAAPLGGDALKLQAALQKAVLPDGVLTGAPSLTADLKTALLGLRQALQTWLAPKADAALPQQTTLPSHAPAPPHRSGPTVPQQPAFPGTDGLPLHEAGLRLLGETDAALARHTLLQIASLPDESSPLRASDPAQRLVFDIPLATPQGTAIVQLRIERDGKRDGKDPKKSGWRVMFSVDVEPIGPVHARVAMVGDQANVSLFAERGDSAKALRDAMPLLEAGLNEAAIEPGEILCVTGAPASPVAAPGLFVDRAS